MSTAAKVAIQKRKHPDYYCPVPRCLWRTMVCDLMTRKMVPAPNCESGYCPRHASSAAKRSVDVLEPIRAAVRTEGFLFAAMRKHGVL
jgi:hypothetical protein